MVAKIRIEIEGNLESIDVQALKQYILDYCKNNNVDSYYFRAEDEFGVRENEI